MPRKSWGGGIERGREGAVAVGMERGGGQDTLVSASIYSAWIVSAWQPAIRPNISREERYGGRLTRSVHETRTIGGTLSLSFRSTTCLGIKLYRPDRRYKHGGSEVQTMYNIMYTIRALLSLLL